LLGKEETCNGEEGRRPLLVERMPSLDDLSRELASGTISRGRAIKLTGGAFLGTALLALFSSPAAQARRSRGPCSGEAPICETSPEGPNCRDNPACFCFRRPGGRKQCLDTTGAMCPTVSECDRTRDCPSGEVCAVVPGCCGSGINVCLPPCPSG